MTQPVAYFVQFPHPGEEHRPHGSRMPWNVGDHKRKFLTTPGRYVDAAGEVAEADLVFWAEWEPPSEVVATWPPSSDLPRWLHRPYGSAPQPRLAARTPTPGSSVPACSTPTAGNWRAETPTGCNV